MNSKEYSSGAAVHAVNQYRKVEIDTINNIHEDMHEKVRILHSVSKGDFSRLANLFKDHNALIRFSRALKLKEVENKSIQRFIIESIEKHVLNDIDESELNATFQYDYQLSSPAQIRYKEYQLATYNINKGTIAFYNFSKAVSKYVDVIHAEEESLLKDEEHIEELTQYTKNRFSWLKALNPEGHGLNSYVETAKHFFKLLKIGNRKRQENVSYHISRRQAMVDDLKESIAKKNKKLDELLLNRDRILELQDELRVQFDNLGMKEV